MFDTFKKTALSALVGLATLGGVSAASAEGITFGLVNDGNLRVGVHVSDNGFRQSGHAERRHERDRWDRDRRDRDGWNRGHRRSCTPARAMDKAERLGLHRVRVVDVDRRSIEVAGRRHGDRIHLTFARAPNCPVIR
jgi:hypothetical protein